jgi:hypothetical protein
MAPRNNTLARDHFGSRSTSNKTVAAVLARYLRCVTDEQFLEELGLCERDLSQAQIERMTDAIDTQLTRLTKSAGEIVLPNYEPEGEEPADDDEDDDEE